jgi:hypothetical protein
VSDDRGQTSFLRKRALYVLVQTGSVSLANGRFQGGSRKPLVFSAVLAEQIKQPPNYPA